MLRRTGFKTEPRPERKPLAWPGVQNFKPVADVGIPITAQPKREYIRSRKLLDACREIPCQVSGVSDGTVVAAHSNQAIHGKGRGIKADDNRVAAMSYAIHAELDQGKKWSRAEAQAIWWQAHISTVRELLARGLWPLDVPIPDLREFDA